MVQGAFLKVVFDVLHAEYLNINAQIATITGNMDVFDTDKTIYPQPLWCRFECREYRNYQIKPLVEKPRTW